MKGIIFDLGGTLIRFTRDWDELLNQSAEAMTTWYLKKKRIKLDSQALIDAFFSQMKTNRQQAQETQTEIPIEQSLQAALEAIDAPKTASAFTEAAIKIFFEAEEAAWELRPDTISTIKTLKAQGYRLGLYSNADDDKSVQRLVNTMRLRPLLSPTFSSAGLGWRKPKADGFLHIAGRWQLDSAHIVVVGDAPAIDILGAHNAGMHGILLAPEPPPQTDVQPDATISQLSQLPDLLKTM